MKNIITFLFSTTFGWVVGLCVLGPSIIVVQCLKDNELKKVGPEVQQYVSATVNADSEIASVNTEELRDLFDYGFIGQEYTVEAFQYGSAYYHPLYFFGNHPLDIIDRVGY